MNSARTLVLLLIFILPYNIHSQAFKAFSPPVTINNAVLDHPWLGGLNTPQIMNSTVSFDGETAEVTLFDRTGGVWLPFHIQSGKLVYLPALKSTLPRVKEWVVMNDYDRDGLIDIFSYSTTPGVAGIDVYHAANGTKGISFTKKVFPNDRNDIIFYSSGSSRFNAYVSNIDYPAIVDIDRDGDMDVLSYEVGGGQIIWYKNLAVEKKLPASDFDMVIGDFCFGKILEDGFSDKITLSNNKDKCASGLLPPLEVRHSGSTILAFDRDQDRDYDLLIGDISSPHLIYLRNGGDTSYAWMDQEEVKFPSNSKAVDIPYFVSPFLADVTGDGVKELFAASNFTFGSDNYRCLWRYDRDKAVPTNYNFVSDVFLINQTIDFGENTYPSVADIDGDGLEDIVVGSGGYFDRVGIHDAGLYLFKNIGTEKSPAFKLIDTNWLNFHLFNNFTNSFAPAFGDLDGDGDLDLIVGELLGTLFYAENTGGKNKSMKFDKIISNFSSIDIGQYSVPQILDLDHDGLQDIIIGERDGIINFFKNKGSAASPLFSAAPEISDLGKIDTRVTGYATGNAAPFFFSSKGKAYLAVGTSGQDILLYENPTASNVPYSKLSGQWGSIHEGDESHPSITDIDHDGFLDVLVGNQRGGLAWYRTDLMSEFSTGTFEKQGQLEVEIFPNPATDGINITLGEIIQNAHLVMYDITGKLIFKRNVHHEDYVSILGIPSGVYILEIQAGNIIRRKKLMVNQ